MTPLSSVAKTVLLSLLPGAFWFAYLRTLSRGKFCAWWHWLLAFGAGWLSTEVTLLISESLGVDALRRLPYAGTLVFFVLGVGLVEESAKALCALLFLKLPGFCREPLFALQLCGGVALGFATAENVLYAQGFGHGVLVGRFLFATLGHVLFASVWGFALGLRSFEDPKSGELKEATPWLRFTKFLLLSSLAHGLYDWFLVSGRPAFAILTLVVLWYGFREAVLGAYMTQAYRRKAPFELVNCPHCSVMTRNESYCSFCGQPLKQLQSPEEASEPEPLPPEEALSAQPE